MGVYTVYGFFDPSYRGIICIFLLAYIIHENYISRYYKIAILLIIFFIGFQYDEKKSEELNLSYKLISTDISQDQKFLQENVSVNSDNLIKEIIQAINEKRARHLARNRFCI